MRFMLFMFPPEAAEAGVMPDTEAIGAMMKYNEELTKAGVLLALDGLHPTAKGARVTFAGGKTTVTDGPFTEAKEVIGGYWIIQTKSKEEAVEWASRCPAVHGDSGCVIEVRQIFDPADFGEQLTPELREAQERVGAQIAENAKK